MSRPWLLVAAAVALTLTLTGGVPGGRAAEQRHQDLDNLLVEAQSLLLLGDSLDRLQGDLQRLEGHQSEPSTEFQGLHPTGLSKRQHPGKREPDSEEGEVEEEEEEGGAGGGPHKRQHPGRREDEASWAEAGGRDRRQHPGRRLADPEAQRNREVEDEEEEEEGLTPQKRQHPGKRRLGGPCGPLGGCGAANLLLGLLEDSSRARGSEQRKRQHPGRRAASVWRPLVE
uniref:Pro-thyrotropin-releasing hormone n=1 Tax=Microcebus murinus TaxID=30608 RepID=A0A8B7F7X6_MICMU|nr:thyrotropin releasing hormone [Microcebus murinus]XP_012604018.1 thyrotropin releasing hormone [Microcebus murinus]